MRRRALLAGLTLAFAAGPAEAELPAKIKIAVPPGGSATLISPALPATATQASVEVQAPSDPFLRQLRTAFTTIRSRRARLLGCLIFSTAKFEGTAVKTIVAVDDSLQALFLAACIEMARTTPVSGPAARAAAAGCTGAGRGVPMTVTGTRGDYELAMDGTIRSRKAPLTGSCRRTAKGYKITLRARKRGLPIRRLVGAKLRVGIANTSAARGGTVTTTFDAR